IEAKEGLPIQAESQTLASTTFQNYFRLYNKLSGMTGTADTEAFEFHQIYGLAVIVIPTNRALARKDFNDLVYLTAEEKYAAIVTDIKESMALGRPVLVGTATIETSEHMSALLNQAGIEHKVLNAKFHEKEAEIIAQAGRPGALTIATNMAGRGTDILLGGNWEVEVANLENATPEQIAQIKADWQKRHQQVIESGGLHVIASERHESRRIDNQLRGRAGRQGDPGSSRFYLSLEDSLMRIFASDRVKNFMKALGMQSGEAIEHRMVSNAIEKAQRKVEGRNFDMRKQLLEFDDVANEQRKVIYHMRNTLLAADNIGETIAEFRQEVLDHTINQHIAPQSLPEQWDIAGLEEALYSSFNLRLPIQQWLDDDHKLYEETLRARILEELVSAYNEKEIEASVEALRTFEKQILLRVLDDLWKDHLSTMDHLRHGIHLRGYAQKNPKQEYKRESFTLFQELLDSIKRDTIRVLSHVQVRREDPAEEEARLRREAEALAERMQFQHAEASALLPQATDEEGDLAVAVAPVRTEPKIGRNEPCPCGSGKKYKHCHGQVN
ncbi:MAG: SEC-C metal-binding domain-containing protein, partial [Pseudomonas sp.]|nr:SEC-C metal-binding domain-containing protein [Pseudomonas sp.]